MIQGFTSGALLLLILILIVLMCVGCQQSTIVSTLEGVVSAAEIAIPVIGAATGLSPATSQAIVSYLQQVDLATAQAATILAVPGTSAQKAANIVKLFAAIAQGCNCVPPGTPQEVVSVVNAVVQAVLQFVANFPPANPPAVKVSASDRTRLAAIRTRAEANTEKLKGVRR